MLEKIGLPAKPSQRGNNWVVDASHCQGCASQFTFFNRKHHCRRCGGLFCNNCTLQRMLLRGQGDSPVRICDPCKKLEEATRFELRYGARNRAGRGASKSVSVSEELHNQDAEEEAIKSLSFDPSYDLGQDSPEELRRQALEEKKNYKILKGEGKSEEALKAFKRGKELERQAGALEIALRKSQRKSLVSASSSSSSIGGQKVNNIRGDLNQKHKLSDKSKTEKTEFSDELRELGWSEGDLLVADKKPEKLSLENELSHLIRDVPQDDSKGNRTTAADNPQVVAHKKKALMFKREGKLAEAKEELKKAKVLEKEIEEMGILAEIEDSDDELSALLVEMHGDKNLHDDGQVPNIDLNHLMSMANDLISSDVLEVTEDDMNDPEIVSALKLFGWDEELDNPTDMEALKSEVLSLKREAVSLKRSGNIEQAMSQLKRAKLLERNLEKMQSSCQPTTVIETSPLLPINEKSTPIDMVDGGNENFKPAPKSKLAVQRELLAVRRSALALRREGRLDEAEEELKKGKILELQLEEEGNVVKRETGSKNAGDKHDTLRTMDVGEEREEVDVTDQDMQDPAMQQLLKDIGWKDEEAQPESYLDEVANKTDNRVSHNPSTTLGTKQRSKAEIQRELLGIKRNARSLRQQGRHEEAEEQLRLSKVLEAQLAEMEEHSYKKVLTGSDHEEKIGVQLLNDQEDPKVDVSDGDMEDPEFSEVLKGLGSEENESTRTFSVVSSNANQFKKINYESSAETDPSIEPIVASGLNVSLQSAVRHPPKGLDGKVLRIPVEKSVDEVSLKRKVHSLATSDDKSDKLHKFKGDIECQDAKLYNGIDNSMPRKEEEIVPSQKIVNQGEKCFKIDEDSCQKNIQAHKKKAVALKREGKLAEALEELRQAKVLEKTLLGGNTEISEGKTLPFSAPAAVPPMKEVQTNVTSKPLSTRHRLKLQQQCLNHKRLARRLQMEGNVQEAMDELELAKAIECQLEESAAQDASSSSKKVEPVANVSIEDFLDPQLVSALKAIGLQDVATVSQPSNSLEAEPDDNRSETIKQEKSQLEGQIKAEKMQALSLKRAGSQAEALDALRRAKQLEKKLNALMSS